MRTGSSKFSDSKSTDASKAFEKVVRLLSRRDHSIKELKEKLKRTYEADAIVQAIEKADGYRLLKNPEELSLQVTASLHKRFKGQRRIAQELSKKGLPSTPVDQDIELEKARQLLEKMVQDDLEQLGFEAKMKLKQKAFRFLQSRGFDFETIRLIVDEKL